jgi:hypothetical protein
VSAHALLRGLPRLGLGLGLASSMALAGGLSAASDSDSLVGLKGRLEMQFEAQVRPLLESYCAACHGEKKHKGDINFTALGTDPTANRGVWTTCSEKLRIHEMPPEKEKQPSDAERSVLLAWINALKRLSPQDPGRFVIRRLTKVEYANTLHDLLGVDPGVASELPLEMVGEGYTNTISALLMEKYLLIADEVLDAAIKPAQLDLAWTAGQLDAVVDGKRDARRADGLERRFSGAGEISGAFTVPCEGACTLRIKAQLERAGKEVAKDPVRLTVRVNDSVVGELKLSAVSRAPVDLSLSFKPSPGKARFSVLINGPASAPAPTGKAAAKAAATPVAEPAGKDEARSLVIAALSLSGPPVTPPSEAQRRLFVAMPGPELGRREAAKRIAESFARRAFRRPPIGDEIATLLGIFDLADAQDEGFTDAVKLMIKAVLMSPQFLFITPDAAVDRDKAISPLGDHQLAARLSYLIWATMPDAELGSLADQGRLHDAEVLNRQTRRLLADPRAQALFDGFGAQWLGLDKLEDQPFDDKKFPLMGKEMRHAMYQEASMLFAAVLHDDHSIGELLDCDYTFLNERLAKIYGLEAEVKGAAMRRVQLMDGNRGGVLTLPGVLAVNSLPNRTSPVRRGRWVLEQILGESPSPPPADVPPLEKQDTAENAALNLRSRTERHRADPACAGCHRILDPIGFGLENFDAIGRWRERDDTGAAVDAGGELPGGRTFATPRELKRLIAENKDAFCHALVSKLLAYALCRHLEGYDEVVVDDISAAIAKGGYHFQALVVAVSTSYPMLNRRTSR